MRNWKDTAKNIISHSKTTFCLILKAQKMIRSESYISSLIIFWTFCLFFSLFLKLHLNRHDVVVHEESVADGEIALGNDVHTHLLVKPHGIVLTIHV